MWLWRKSMRSLSIQVQPERSPNFDRDQLTAAFLKIAESSDLVRHHTFDNGYDDGAYFNYTFDTENLAQLWRMIQETVFEISLFKKHLRKSAIVVCTGDDEWNDYLLLHHWDPTEPIDSLS
jgi:hypothetical protein